MADFSKKNARFNEYARLKTGDLVTLLDRPRTNFIP